MEQPANKRCEAGNEPPMWLANLDAIRNELSGAACEQLRALLDRAELTAMVLVDPYRIGDPEYVIPHTWILTDLAPSRGR